MAGIVNPTIARVTAQLQKLFATAVKHAPVIRVARQVKNDNLRPNLKRKMILDA